MVTETVLNTVWLCLHFQPWFSCSHCWNPLSARESFPSTDRTIETCLQTTPSKREGRKEGIHTLARREADEIFLSLLGSSWSAPFTFSFSTLPAKSLQGEWAWGTSTSEIMTQHLYLQVPSHSLVCLAWRVPILWSVLTEGRKARAAEETVYLRSRRSSTISLFKI